MVPIFGVIAVLLVLSLPLVGQAPHTDHGPPAKPSPEASAPEKKPTGKEEVSRAAVEVPPEQQEKMGVRLATVRTKQVERDIRTVGIIKSDERREAHIHTKINGWIEEIHADFVGKPVKKGQALFDLYSPDLVATQEEYLSARKQGRAGAELAKIALERLRLWAIPESEIEKLKRTGKSRRTVTFRAPVSGFIVKKGAIKGMFVSPEMELYHIADLSRVWVVLTLYEYDLPIVKVGDEARVSLPYAPGAELKGTVAYIYPEIEEATRAGKARVEVKNPREQLKPGMFATVFIEKDLGEALVVPDDAVIDTGLRKIVFVKTSPTRFEPREVKTGPRVERSFVILSGLKPREQIASGAHFLIDAESRFQAALQKEGPKSPAHGGHGE